MSVNTQMGQIERICEISNQLYSPFELDDSLYICSNNGEIHKIQSGQVKQEYNFGGSPSSLIIDSKERTIFVADMAQKFISVRSLDKPNEQPEILKEYQGKPFIGPNSMILSKINNCLYFTDSGPFCESTIDQNSGSVFMIDLELQIVKSLSYQSLSYPSGIAQSKNEKIIYVSETYKNRIVRFIQTPQGIYYSNVFMQFQGRYGPMSLAVSSSDLLFVVRYEIQQMTRDGMISIVNPNSAQIIGNVICQFQPEISGLILSKQNNVMYATDNSKFPCFIRIIYQNPEIEDDKSNA